MSLGPSRGSAAPPSAWVSFNNRNEITQLLGATVAYRCLSLLSSRRSPNRHTQRANVTSEFVTSEDPAKPGRKQVCYYKETSLPAGATARLIHAVCVCLCRSWSPIRRNLVSGKRRFSRGTRTEIIMKLTVLASRRLKQVCDSTDSLRTLIPLSISAREATVVFSRPERNWWTCIMPWRLSRITSKLNIHMFNPYNAQMALINELLSHRKALREVKALSDVSHQNIVRYYSCWKEDSHYKQETGSVASE